MGRGNRWPAEERSSRQKRFNGTSKPAEAEPSEEFPVVILTGQDGAIQSLERVLKSLSSRPNVALVLVQSHWTAIDNQLAPNIAEYRCGSRSSAANFPSKITGFILRREGRCGLLSANSAPRAPAKSDGDGGNLGECLRSLAFEYGDRAIAGLAAPLSMDLVSAAGEIRARGGVVFGIPRKQRTRETGMARRHWISPLVAATAGRGRNHALAREFGGHRKNLILAMEAGMGRAGRKIIAGCSGFSAL